MSGAVAHENSAAVGMLSAAAIALMVMWGSRKREIDGVSPV